MVEGLIRGTVSEAVTERGTEIFAISDALAVRAVDEFDTAQVAGMIAQEAVVFGVIEVAEGSATIGTGEATSAMGAVLEERANL